MDVAEVSDGTGLAPPVADLPEAPAPDQPWEGPWLGAMAQVTPIYPTARFSRNRLGYIRRGGKGTMSETTGVTTVDTLCIETRPESGSWANAHRRVYAPLRLTRNVRHQLSRLRRHVGPAEQIGEVREAARAVDVHQLDALHGPGRASGR